jgi:hypothetical protein
MKNKVLLISIIIILILINIGTLTFMWVNRPGQTSPENQPDPTRFLVKKLGLDASQRAIFGQERFLFRTKMHQLQQRDHALHKKFFDLVLHTRADTSSAIQLADSIAAIRMEMEMMTFSYFSQLRRILYESQRMKFDTIFFDALRIMLPSPPPPPPPPPPSLAPPPPPPPNHK